jgi:hypothetical protein
MYSAYALSDVAGEHYWTPDGSFAPVPDRPYRREDILCFATKREAQQVMQQQKKKGCYLKVTLVWLSPS